MASYEHVLAMPTGFQERGRKTAVRSCPSLQKAIATLFGFAPHNVVARKGQGYGGGVWIYICFQNQLWHFKINRYSVAMSETLMLHYAKEIREIMMPGAKPYEWENIDYAS